MLEEAGDKLLQRKELRFFWMQTHERTAEFSLIISHTQHHVSALTPFVVPEGGDKAVLGGGGGGGGDLFGERGYSR